MRCSCWRFWIAAPIGAGQLGQLEGVADLAGRRHVRAAAEVEPVALEVDLQVLVGRDGVDQLDLEHLALPLEDFARASRLPDLLGEGQVAGDDLAHLRFDRRRSRRSRTARCGRSRSRSRSRSPGRSSPACPGKSSCTASASTCAQSWRISSSAAGSSRVTIATDAPSGTRSARSASTPSTFIATAFLASDLEIDSATARPFAPSGKSRLAPSGKRDRDHGDQRGRMRLAPLIFESFENGRLAGSVGET